jgi:hypothetical protein
MVFWSPIPMVYRTPYTWYFDPPTNSIFNPLSMVHQTSNPWYFDLLPMAYRPPTHGILTSLPIVYRPPTHGILTLLPMVFWPLYPWYIAVLPMVFWHPYPLYFDPPNYGISYPLSEGGQNTMDRGVNIPWVARQYTMGRGVKIPWAGGSKYHG